MNMKNVWRWVRWPLVVLALLFVAYLAWGVYLFNQKNATERGVALINSHKLTLADVEGKNLPPAPNQAENDATVAGIDKNNNSIRDDVELAIFKKYPNDAKVRAAELQYAMALQTDITEAFNSETWLAAEYQESRAFSCIGENYPKTNLKQHLASLSDAIAEVEEMQFNTEQRRTAREKFLRMEVGTSLPHSDLCDVNQI
jgi:hypothetical protein